MRLYDYAASANCLKVRLLLAQLGLPYERVPVDIFAGETLTDAFLAVNPVRATPVLEPEPGRFLPESNAILLFLAEGTPLLPADPFARAQACRWLFFEQADVVPTMGGLRFRLQTGRLAPESEDAQRRARGAAATLTVPRLGVTTPHSIEMAVVLPAPLGPSSPKISPWRTSRLSPRRATNRP